MKNTLYAILAACLAMLATSGLVAFATAAPPGAHDATVARAEAELTAQLDVAIARQLQAVKRRVADARE